MQPVLILFVQHSVDAFLVNNIYMFVYVYYVMEKGWRAMKHQSNNVED